MKMWRILSGALLTALLVAAPHAFAVPGTTIVCTPGHAACATVQDEHTEGGTCAPDPQWHYEHHGVAVTAEPAEDTRVHADAGAWCRSGETTQYTYEATGLAANAHAEAPFDTDADARAGWSGSEKDYGFFGIRSCDTDVNAHVDALNEDVDSETSAGCPIGRPPAALFDLLP